MKKLVVRAILFGVIFLVLGYASYCFNKFLFQKYSFKLPKEVNKIIVGDSQSACGINPAEIPGSFNASHMAEPYVVTYYKIKHLYKANPGINSIIIVYTPLSFSGFKDLLFEKQETAIEMYAKFYNLLSMDEIKNFRCKKNYYIENAVRYKVFPNFTYYGIAINQTYPFFSARHPYIGRFDPMEGVDRKNYHLQKTYRKFFLIDQKVTLSQSDAPFLDSIASFVNQNKMKLILVTPPIHKSFKPLIPNEAWDIYNSKKQLLSKNPDVLFINYETLSQDTTWFRDYIHLNNKGSAIVSRQLNSDLKILNL